MVKKFKRIASTIIFLLIFGMIFCGVSETLARKTLGGSWNYTKKVSGLYNEPENEFDVMFFGSSNTYCSFSPLIMYEKQGIKSYVFATQQQPTWATYTYIKEALKTQSPSLVVLDVLMFAGDLDYYDDGVNYSFMDDLPFSLNKIELAFASAEDYEPISLLFNVIKYHTRWAELKETDYDFDRSEMRDYLKGHVIVKNEFKEATPPATDVAEITPITEKNEKYLRRIIDLCEKEGVKLLLVKAPSNETPDEAKLYNYVWSVAEAEGVDYVNFNDRYEDIGIDFAVDFYDDSHLNFRGAAKFSEYFASFLTQEKGIVPMGDTNGTAEQWQADIALYYETHLNK